MSFVEDEMRGVEAELVKIFLVVCFCRVVEDFNILQFFPEQTTESRSGTDRDKIRRLKVGLKRLLLSNNHFGIFVSYFDPPCLKFTMTSGPTFCTSFLKNS